MSSFADQLWSTKREFIKLEDELVDHLNRIFGTGKWEDFTHDSYDSSIEIMLFTGDMSEENQRELYKLGFQQVWTHPGLTRVSELESYYNLSKFYTDNSGV